MSLRRLLTNKLPIPSTSDQWVFSTRRPMTITALGVRRDPSMNLTSRTTARIMNPKLRYHVVTNGIRILAFTDRSSRVDSGRRPLKNMKARSTELAVIQMQKSGSARSSLTRILTTASCPVTTSYTVCYPDPKVDVSTFTRTLTTCSSGTTEWSISSS